MRDFSEMLHAKWAERKFVCVGLDSQYDRIPKCVHVRFGSDVQGAIFYFNSCIVETTKCVAGSYKLNTAFYEAYGEAGLRALKRTIEYIHEVSPGTPVILDAKRADIGNTNWDYVAAAFRECKADAVTVNPYFGEEALRPFLIQKGKGIIVICRTSNPGAREFQDLHTLTLDPRARPEGVSAEEWLDQLSADSMRLYERVAFNVATRWNKKGNCLLVVGATYPVEAKSIRAKVGDIPFLIIGVGTQGGDVEATVLAGMDGRRMGMIIGSSSDIIFASGGRNFSEAAGLKARGLHDKILQAMG